MDELNNQDKAGKDFWENTWREIPAGKYIGIEKHLAINRKLFRLFRRYLTRGNKRILELGCAKGKYLVHFAREFGYEVYGVDYSEKGAAMASENLKAAGVKGTIVCQDIFQTDLPKQSFDIVYSMGLIEHFEDPTEIINAHINLLKTGGTLIITMPNLKNSFVYKICKIVGTAKELTEKHNLKIMDTKALGEIARKKEIEILKLGYFGPVDLTTAFSGIKRKPLLYLAHLLNQIIGYATFYMKGSAYFSPYIVLIGKRRGTTKTGNITK